MPHTCGLRTGLKDGTCEGGGGASRGTSYIRACRQLTGRTACCSCVNTLWGSDRVLRSGQFLGRLIGGSPEVRLSPESVPRWNRRAALPQCVHVWVGHVRSSKPVAIPCIAPFLCHPSARTRTHTHNARLAVFSCAPACPTRYHLSLLHWRVQHRKCSVNAWTSAHISDFSVRLQLGSEANALGLVFGAGTPPSPSR